MSQEHLRSATPRRAPKTARSLLSSFAGMECAGLFDRAMQSAAIGVWVCDLQSETLSWTRGVYDMFEIAAASAPDRRHVVEYYHDSSKTLLADLREKAIRHGESFELDARIATPSGATRWIKISADVEYANGKAARLFGLKRDITEETLLLDHWRRVAHEDPLTGLGNRAAFQNMLHGERGDGSTASAIGALVLIDLDNFKELNDRFGHLAGDTCLTKVAERLRAMTQAHLIARIGGDEFAVTFDRASDPASIESAVRHVLAALSRPIRWNGRKLNVTASAGIAFGDARNSSDAASLYARADRALYGAKLAGRNQWRVSPDAGCS